MPLFDLDELVVLERVLEGLLQFVPKVSSSLLRNFIGVLLNVFRILTYQLILGHLATAGGTFYKLGLFRVC